MISDAELHYWTILWSLEKRMDDANLTEDERDEVIARLIQQIRDISKKREEDR